MKVTVEVNPDRRSGAISPYIYGQYFEHLEDCIYPSVWDHESVLSDGQGLRKDVIQAAAELGTPVVRWPGGCFADFYHWEDGVGPRDRRPVKRNWHWGGTESHQFGTDEFLSWCEKAGTEPYINFNLGTGTLEEALRWMDYCNGTEPTADVERRKANGRDQPYGVKFWGIGNETYGAWEAGAMGADAYADKLANWVQFVRKFQPGAKILAVGKPGDTEWNRAVLQAAGRSIDYLTMHTYAHSIDRVSGDEYYPIAFTPAYVERNMRDWVDTVNEFAPSRAGRPIRIAIDEWNIRHFTPVESMGRYALKRSSPRNIQDAVYTAGMLNSMIRLSPGVAMANYVFLVNGNAVMIVHPEGVVKTPLYYVFQQYGRWMQGDAVETVVNGPKRVPPAPRNGQANVPAPEVPLLDAVPYVDAAAAWKDKTLSVALVNRHQTEAAEVALLLPTGYSIDTAWVLHHEQLYAVNDRDQPELIVPTVHKLDPESGVREWLCPAHSVVLLSCREVGPVE